VYASRHVVLGLVLVKPPLGLYLSI